MKYALDHILERISTACAMNDRASESVRLLLASKHNPVEAVREAYGLGHRLFGENIVQEAVPKIGSVTDLDIEWHFIGHLQSNKVKPILPYVSCVQSVDRTSLVDELQSQAQKIDKKIDVLVEVNTSQESSKHGCDPDKVNHLLEYIHHATFLNVRGFMTIGALTEDERLIRNCFALLRSISDNAISQGFIRNDATELSMGMSGDLELAIAEGSTMVRVGSAVFGERI